MYAGFRIEALAMRIRHATGFLAAGLLVSLISGWGSAQVSYRSGGYVPPQGYPAFPSSGRGGYGWGYGGGGTAAGSYMNGMANVVRSAGYANVMNSLAAQNYEQAYSQDLDNRLKATNTYFEMRRVNTAARAEERGPPPTAAELAHYAEAAAPKRLTSSQLDPVTGELNWPLILSDGRYAKQRETIDQLFGQRQSNNGGGVADYRAINDAIEAIRAALVKNIKEYSPPLYLESRKFLDSLQYEARFVES
jgi:hypothetical protein